MYMIAMSCYPQESATELGKRFMETKPAPDFMTTLGPFIKSTLEGTKTITIYDFDTKKGNLRKWQTPEMHQIVFSLNVSYQQ